MPYFILFLFLFALDQTIFNIIQTDLLKQDINHHSIFQILVGKSSHSINTGRQIKNTIGGQWSQLF